MENICSDALVINNFSFFPKHLCYYALVPFSDSKDGSKIEDGTHKLVKGDIQNQFFRTGVLERFSICKVGCMNPISSTGKYKLKIYSDIRPYMCVKLLKKVYLK